MRVRSKAVRAVSGRLVITAPRPAATEPVRPAVEAFDIAQADMRGLQRAEQLPSGIGPKGADRSMFGLPRSVVVTCAS